MLKMINGFNSRTHMLGGTKAHMSDLEIKMTAGFMALRRALLYISIFLPLHQQRRRRQDDVVDDEGERILW